MALTFTEDEGYEVNDAIHEVVSRMLNEGQSPEEIKYHSLARLWSAWRKITAETLGTADTPGMLEVAPKIEAAIAKPKRLKRAAK